MLPANTHLLAVLSVTQIRLPVRPSISISPGIFESAHQAKSLEIKEGKPHVVSHKERKSCEQNTDPIGQLLHEDSERVADHARGLAGQIANN